MIDLDQRITPESRRAMREARPEQTGRRWACWAVSDDAPLRYYDSAGRGFCGRACAEIYHGRRLADDETVAVARRVDDAEMRVEEAEYELRAAREELRQARAEWREHKRAG